MIKRLKFECWNCERNYSLTLNLAGKPKLAVECPFCGKEGIVELDPYREDHVEVLKSDTDAETNVGTTFNFPEVIPTSQPES